MKYYRDKGMSHVVYEVDYANLTYNEHDEKTGRVFYDEIFTNLGYFKQKDYFDELSDSEVFLYSL